VDVEVEIGGRKMDEKKVSEDAVTSETAAMWKNRDCKLFADELAKMRCSKKTRGDLEAGFSGGYWSAVRAFRDAGLVK